MTILHYAHGDLKVIINELEVEELTAVNGAQLVFDHIKRNTMNTWIANFLEQWKMHYTAIVARGKRANQ